MTDHAHDGTYSPEDNKLRLYPAWRLDPEEYERVKSEGFRWAPKQELFVAPAWSPSREDLLIVFCGSIEDEDTSLATRADDRADRFDGYQGKRLAEAEAQREAVASIADGIPLGQPILVGHHSQRRAERDAEKIRRGMRKAVDLWKTSKYWTARAAGVRSHADYKHRPDVTARRIKKLEAERRKDRKQLAADEKNGRAWATPNLTDTQALLLANYASPFYGLWSDLNDGKVTTTEAQAQAAAAYAKRGPHLERWIAHTTLRIGYERAIVGLDTPADEDTPKVKRTAPKLPPIVNFDGMVQPGKAGTWDRQEYPPVPTKTITKDDWKQKNRDYKGTRLSACGTYRYRTMMYREDGHLTTGPVYISDQKTVEPAGYEAPAPVIVDTNGQGGLAL